jgi:hypothetical protein
VPKANKAAYVKHATEAASYFKKLGATRLVECLGVRSGLAEPNEKPRNGLFERTNARSHSGGLVPKGALTDFYKGEPPFSRPHPSG